MDRPVHDPHHWTEADSERFAEMGDVYVPARAEQRRVLLDLIPAGPDEPFRLVELAAGDGGLSAAVLERFPRSRVLALDGSDHMLERARRRLAPFGPRAEVRRFDLARRDWRTALPAPLRCVVSSLAVHHLPGPDKRRLFADLAGSLEPGGALLLADLVEAACPRIAAIFAAEWDEAVWSQGLAVLGGERALDVFRAERANFYAMDVPDAIDQPSRLVDQLDWLREAGLSTVDCFWMQAGHAIYGGYR